MAKPDAIVFGILLVLAAMARPSCNTNRFTRPSFDFQMISGYRDNQILIPIESTNKSGTNSLLTAALFVVRSHRCPDLTCQLMFKKENYSTLYFDYRLQKWNLTLAKTSVFRLVVRKRLNLTMVPINENISVTCSSNDGSKLLAEYTVMGRSRKEVNASKVICRQALSLILNFIVVSPNNSYMEMMCQLIHHMILGLRQYNNGTGEPACLTLTLVNLNYLLRNPSKPGCSRSYPVLHCLSYALTDLLLAISEVSGPRSPSWITLFRQAAEEFAAMMERFVAVLSRQKTFANASIAFSVLDVNSTNDSTLAVSPSPAYQEVRVQASENLIHEVSLGSAHSASSHGQRNKSLEYLLVRLPARVSKSGRWTLMASVNDHLLYVKEFDTEGSSSKKTQAAESSDGSDQDFIGAFTVDLKTELVSPVLSDPVYITFRKKAPNPRGISKAWTPRCVFWNETVESWSSIGCWMTMKTETSVTCACVHLTAFSVLFVSASSTAYSDAAAHHKIMSTLTYITSALSVICLIFMIASYSLFLLSHHHHHGQPANRDLTSSQLTLVFLVQLAVQFSLFLVNSLIQSKPEWLCQAIASSLHCTMMAASLTSNCLSTHIFLTIAVPIMLPHVLQCQVQRHYLKISLLIGSILPALTVALTFSATLPRGFWPYSSYAEYNRKQSFCWLDREPLIYAFLIPFGISLTYNFLLTVVSLVAVFYRRGQQSPNANAKCTLARRLQQVFGLTCLLGLTWILGIIVYLIRDEQSAMRRVLEYAFIIINASQGVFIFLLFFLAKRDTVRVWRQWLPCCESGSAYKTSNNTSF